jgi:hypothetical protein
LRFAIRTGAPAQGADDALIKLASLPGSHRPQPRVKRGR